MSRPPPSAAASRLPVVALWSRGAGHAEALVHEVPGARFYAGATEALGAAEIAFVTVADDAVAGFAAELAKAGSSVPLRLRKASSMETVRQRMPRFSASASASLTECSDENPLGIATPSKPQMVRTGR